ncbi:MAG TPA: sodium/glutamate symporter, partial [Sedimentibacter sp.]|nr:sodium/glutamate symporter [Sedimentibacter sp.]
MDFSESSVWSTFTQFGILCLILLAANTLRTHVPILRKSLLPTAVIGGLIGFALRSLGLGSLFDTRFLNMIIYHFMAIGFIALSLKTSYGKGEIKRQASKDAFNSGLLIVGSYLLQALIGFSITILLALTIMPDLFKASGLLLPLGFGQGPGQANNWGYIYENTRYNTTESFIGGQTFGITIASIGFLCACIPGVVYMTWLNSKNKFITAKGFKNESVSDELGSEDEIPLAESIDKFTI